MFSTGKSSLGMLVLIATSFSWIELARAAANETYACPLFDDYPLNSSANVTAQVSNLLFDTTKWVSCSTQPHCMVTILIDTTTGSTTLSSACASICTFSSTMSESKVKSVACYSMPSADLYSDLVRMYPFVYQGECITGSMIDFSITKKPGNESQNCSSSSPFCKSDLEFSLENQMGVLNGSCASSCTPSSMYSGTSFYGTFCRDVYSSGSGGGSSSSPKSAASAVASPSLVGLLAVEFIFGFVKSRLDYV